MTIVTVVIIIVSTVIAVVCAGPCILEDLHELCVKSRWLRADTDCPQGFSSLHLKYYEGHWRIMFLGNSLHECYMAQKPY